MRRKIGSPCRPNAQKTNMTCHFCIVGCGYHVYKWDEGREGGRAPQENALGTRLHASSCRRCTITMTPAMTNVDRRTSDGTRRNIMIVPDKAVRREQRPVIRRAAARWPTTCTRPTASARTGCRRRALLRRPVGRHRLGRRDGDLRRADQEAPRQGWAERRRLLCFRPRRRRRRLREHLGHRQADVHAHCRRLWCASTTAPPTTPSATPPARWASANSTTATRTRSWPT